MLKFSEEHIKSMKLTSYQYWLGNDNPSISAEVAKVYKGKAASAGSNAKLTLHGNSWTVHYSITRLLNEDLQNPKKDSIKEPGVVIFIELVDDEKIIWETLSRYMQPLKVQQAMSPEKRSSLVGTNQKIAYLSASITNCIFIIPLNASFISTRVIRTCSSCLYFKLIQYFSLGVCSKAQW